MLTHMVVITTPRKVLLRANFLFSSHLRCTSQCESFVRFLDINGVCCDERE